MLVTVFIGLFIGIGTMAFIAVAFIFPEWVGIAGKKSQEVEAAHRGENEINDSPGSPSSESLSEIDPHSPK